MLDKAVKDDGVDFDSNTYSPIEHRDSRIAIQVSVTRSFEEGQGVTWATTIPQSASLNEINAVMDKVWAASSRQEKWNRVDRINKEIEHAVRQIAQLQFNLKLLEDRHKDISKAPSDAKAALNQTRDTIVRSKTLIDELRSEQVRMRAELGLE
jgi:septal ring factor EnvC (AmiA/AmiB activator)